MCQTSKTLELYYFWMYFIYLFLVLITDWSKRFHKTVPSGSNWSWQTQLACNGILSKRKALSHKLYEYKQYLNLCKRYKYKNNNNKKWVLTFEPGDSNPCAIPPLLCCSHYPTPLWAVTVVFTWSGVTASTHEFVRLKHLINFKFTLQLKITKKYNIRY